MRHRIKSGKIGSYNPEKIDHGVGSTDHFLR